MIVDDDEEEGKTNEGEIEGGMEDGDHDENEDGLQADIVISYNRDFLLVFNSPGMPQTEHSKSKCFQIDFYLCNDGENKKKINSI